MGEIAAIVYALCVIAMISIMTRKDFDGVPVLFKIVACGLGPISLALAWVIGYTQTHKDSSYD